MKKILFILLITFTLIDSNVLCYHNTIHHNNITHPLHPLHHVTSHHKHNHNNDSDSTNVNQNVDKTEKEDKVSKYFIGALLFLLGATIIISIMIILDI